jgi:predicted site-specific integrase-resolvase
MSTPAQFAKRVNVSVKTIQKWDRLGILPAKRTITNRRYYPDEDLSAALRIPRVPSVRRTESLLPRLKSGLITGCSQSKKNP